MNNSIELINLSKSYNDKVAVKNISFQVKENEIIGNCYENYSLEDGDQIDIISTNKSKISIKDILSWGDDYQLVFTANKKFNNQINKLGKKNNIKLTHIGTVIKDKGIYDDSMNFIKKTT